MRIDVLTIFPEMFAPVLGSSILKRAQENDFLSIQIHDLRDYTTDSRRTIDDRPYGGGPGMIMKPEPIARALKAVKRQCKHTDGAGSKEECQTILMSPQGERLSSGLGQDVARLSHLILICGHYEGVDERVRLLHVDRLVSIGDYVLTGGELPAMVLMDTTARFIPGVIGHAEAIKEESFTQGLLEYPQYTRPPVHQGVAVPDVLLSGNHERITRWRKLQAVARTLASRPDLL